MRRRRGAAGSCRPPRRPRPGCSVPRTSLPGSAYTQPHSELSVAHLPDPGGGRLDLETVARLGLHAAEHDHVVADFAETLGDHLEALPEPLDVLEVSRDPVVPAVAAALVASTAVGAKARPPGRSARRARQSRAGRTPRTRGCTRPVIECRFPALTRRFLPRRLAGSDSSVQLSVSDRTAIYRSTSRSRAARPRAWAEASSRTGCHSSCSVRASSTSAPSASTRITLSSRVPSVK